MSSHVNDASDPAVTPAFLNRKRSIQGSKDDESTPALDQIPLSSLLSSLDKRRLTKVDQQLLHVLPDTLLSRQPRPAQHVKAIGLLYFTEEKSLRQDFKPLNCHAFIYWRFRKLWTHLGFDEPFPDDAPGNHVAEKAPQRELKQMNLGGKELKEEQLDEHALMYIDKILKCRGYGSIISPVNGPYLWDEGGIVMRNPFYETLPGPETWYRNASGYFPYGETGVMQKVISRRIEKDVKDGEAWDKEQRAK